MLDGFDPNDWDEIVPEARRPRQLPHVSLSIGQRSGQGPYRGRLLIQHTVLAELRTEERRCKILLGRGFAAHQLCIIPDRHGRHEIVETAPNTGGRTWRLRLPHVPTFPKCEVNRLPVSHNIRLAFNRQRALFIDLPPMCWDKAEKALAEATAKGKA